MVDHPLQALMNRLMLRSNMGTEELDALRAMPTTSKTIPVHRDFIKVSDDTDHSYLVVSGIVGRFSQMRDGNRQITALHIPGDMADLCSVVFPKTSWAFQALAETEVLCIPHTALREAARSYPGIATAFWRDCVVDMAIMSEGLLTVGRRSAEARVAHLLCEMSCRYRQAGMVDRDCFDWQLRQSHVGDVLGLTAVHINRMLRSLRETGLATVSGTTVTIHDFPGLAKVAEFDPAYLHLSGGDACVE